MAMDNIEKINENLRLRDVMEFYGVEFNARGYAKCPFHSEKTASLSIRNEHYKCFGCNAYGGILDFVMNYFNLNLRQAITRLGNDFSLDLSTKKLTYREKCELREKARLRAAERLSEAEEKKRLAINYGIICEIHRNLLTAYSKYHVKAVKEIIDEIADVLDDFSGREAMVWATNLEAMCTARKTS